MFSLTTTHLRFVCEATTPLRLEADTFRAGSNLRGALGQVMLRSYCPHPQPLSQEERGEHAATCPVHWLLAANEKPGEERRGYALVPPLPNARTDCLNRGDSFEFGLTLFGNALRFLPYFILAVPEMGRLGVGPGRGKFVLKRVWALNPLTGESECLFGDASSRTRDSMGNMRDGASGENGNVVRTPIALVNHETVLQSARSEIENRNATELAAKIEIHFLTPMRLIDDAHTAKFPDFTLFFARLLKRMDDLEEQFSGGTGRALEEVRALNDAARRVQLCEVSTRWVEVFSGSTRRGQPSPMSGFVGRAVFSARREVWQELLPWLLWAQLAQVGKATVKGNGVMEVRRMKDEG